MNKDKLPDSIPHIGTSSQNKNFACHKIIVLCVKFYENCFGLKICGIDLAVQINYKGDQRRL
ncbi:hypothetical protein RUMCAL_00243 [Ruminococcus callidus ATCC 27760]|uniref:Uncharacterized protein n=1 Tax=Ruminococcus callidus ATCC 27760 TaxID=411473 RepID=U2KZ17_9FIRM|nr:hypothetical protein RUMCAL_00243 [Ruminococcus callidus ATCC 27760]